MGPALSYGWPATERIRPAAPAISRAYPVTADVASRTVSPGLACAAIISVLEQSGAQRGETPLPSLGFPPRRLRSSALGSLPGPGRIRRGWRGWVQAWVGAPVSPGRPLRFGYLCFAPRAAYGRFAAVPVVWDVRESCGAVRPARGLAGGCSPGGSATHCGDIPVSPPGPRTGVLPPFRWFGTFRGRQGPSGPHRGLAGGAFTLGLSPAGGAAPVLPGYLLGAAWDIPVLLSDTAHKLARLIYAMLRYGQEYVDAGAEYYERTTNDSISSGRCARPSAGRHNWTTNWRQCPTPGTAPRTHLPARQPPRQPPREDVGWWGVKNGRKQQDGTAPPESGGIIRRDSAEVREPHCWLKVGEVKEIHEMKGAGRPGEGVCRGVFSMAGLPLPVVWGGLVACFLGLFAVLPEALVFPASGASHPRCPVVFGRPSGLAFRAAWRAAFCPYCPAFSGPEGGVGDPGRGDFSPGRKKRTCVKKVRGGIQLRVVGFTRSDLCNERPFRTDVSICTICKYGPDRAPV